MICSNCGREIKENAVFCAYCGVKVERRRGLRKAREQQDQAPSMAAPNASSSTAAPDTSSSTATPDTAQTAAEQDTTTETEEISPTAAETVAAEPDTIVEAEGAEHDTADTNTAKPAGNGARRIARRFLLLVLLAAVLIGGIVCYLKTRRTTVRPNNYVSVTFDGYNTLGTARLAMDEASFVDKYSAQLKVSQKGYAAYLQTTGYSREEAALQAAEYADQPESFVRDLYDVLADGIILTPTEGLSNGDEVTVSWQPDQEDLATLETILHCTVEVEEHTYKVKGLDKIKTYNPFDKVSLTTYGMSPYGTAEIVNENTDEIGAALTFELSQSSDLSNGDVVTVTVAGDVDNAYLADTYNTVISPMSQEYTIEGLQEYLSTAADIPDDLLTQMQHQAEIAMAEENKTLSDEPYTKEILLGTEYVGNYFAVLKNHNAGGDRNAVYLCYKSTVEDYRENEDAFVDEIITTYTYYRFSNLLMDVDGTVSMDLMSWSAPENERKTEHGFVYIGYDSLERMSLTLQQALGTDYSLEDNTQDSTRSYELTIPNTIPEEAEEYNGHYYLRVDGMGAITWEEAENRCEQRGGHLATITNADENAWIVRYMNLADGVYFWIGGEMDQNGIWNWVTGESFSYSNWAPRQPDFTNSSEFYLMTDEPVGTWNDMTNSCTSVKGYIVEWEPAAETAAAEESATEAAEDTAASTEQVEESATE